ncbi:PhoH family protein, partial [Staphylococcus pasteuri]|uniref:PhoH family protein n=1 Tax=Staphylococcus pasteuri TaxID=45972 RepID=UPI0012B80EFA
VFPIPPPRTPETFLPLLYPPKQFRKPNLKPILLTRPALQPGQSLPFLPPHLKQKVHPYLTPLYHPFNTLLPTQQTAPFIQTRIIQIPPLPYIHRPTLHHP